MSEWYYAKDNQQQGPVNEAELKEKFVLNELTAQTLVWSEGMENWAPADSLPNFVFRAPPAPAAQRPEFTASNADGTRPAQAFVGEAGTSQPAPVQPGTVEMPRIDFPGSSARELPASSGAVDLPRVQTDLIKPPPRRTGETALSPEQIEPLSAAQETLEQEPVEPFQAVGQVQPAGQQPVQPVGIQRPKLHPRAPDPNAPTDHLTAARAEQTKVELPTGLGADGSLFRPVPEEVPVAAEDVGKNRFTAMLSYLGLFIVIPLLLGRSSTFTRYHLNQGLLLMVTALLCSLVVTIVSYVLINSIELAGGIFAVLLSLTVGILLLIPVIIGIVNALRGVCAPLPIIGAFRIIEPVLKK